MKLTLYLPLITFVLLSNAVSSAHAQLSGGMGLFSHNIFKVTTSSNAERSMLGTIYLPMIARYETPALLGEVKMAPYLSFTYLTNFIIPVETPDKSAKKNFAILGVPAVVPLRQNWFITAGPGLMYYEIKGKGGVKVVNNGTGTSTFGVPSRTVASKIFLFELGVGHIINDWRVNFDLYFSGVASDRFSTSFQASMAYSFGGLSW